MYSSVPVFVAWFACFLSARVCFFIALHVIKCTCVCGLVCMLSSVHAFVFWFACTQVYMRLFFALHALKCTCICGLSELS